MRPVFFSLIMTIFFQSAFSQANDIYVRLTGKVLSAKDSSAVSASLLYEKLPYYDDMGVSKSNAEGAYEFYLLNGENYNFKVNADGFEELLEEVTVTNENGDGSMTKVFYISPDKELELMTLDNLIFARGSDRITESSYQGLDELVAFLEDRPNVIIQLEGHTDFAGNAEANMNLSQARVDAVKDYLTSKGVKKNRVFTKAFGGTQPLYTERTDEAKTKNRRVEVRILRK